MSDHQEEEASNPIDAARSLLQQLQSDFSAEGKTSCRDCLRSKAMPSLRVVNVVSKQPQLVTPTVLIEAHSLILGDLLRLDTVAADGDTAPPTSVLRTMNSLGTSIRCAQLLLYVSTQQKNTTSRTPLSENNQARTSLSSSNSSSSSSNSSSSNSLSIDQVDRLLSTLLAGLVKAVISQLTLWKATKPPIDIYVDVDVDDTEGDDDEMDPMTMDASTTSSDVRPIACFVFVSLLRLQHFGKSRQQWMVPLVKALGELAGATVSSSILPVSLLADFLRVLRQLLEEGTTMMTKYAVAFLMNPASGPPIPPEHLAVFGRFLSFLVIRVATILPRVVAGEEELKDTTTTTTHHQHQALWKMLVTLRGLAAAMTCRLSSSLPHGTLPPPPPPFLQAYTGLAAKVERQVLKVLLVRSSNNPGDDDSGSNPRIASSFLCALLDLKLQRKRSNNKISSEDPPSPATATDMANQLLRNSRVLGRALILQRFLQVLVSPPSASIAASSWRSADDVEQALRLCEMFHSIILPQCGSLLFTMTSTTATAPTSFTSTSTSQPDLLSGFLSESLLAVATLLVQLDDSLLVQDPTKRAQLHRLMIRWMATPMTPTTTTTTTHSNKNLPARVPRPHPLSRDYVLHVLYLYVTALNGRDGRHREGPHYLPTTSMVHLMVRLLFHIRTTTELRQNISTVVVWILLAETRSKGVDKNNCLVRGMAVGRLVESELEVLWNQWTPNDKPKSRRRNRRKRKRKKGYTTPTLKKYRPDDMEAIGRVLAQLPARTSCKLQAVISSQTFQQKDEKLASSDMQSSTLLLCYFHGAATSPNEMETLIGATDVESWLGRRIEQVVTEFQGIDQCKPSKRLSRCMSLILATLRFCNTLCCQREDHQSPTKTSPRLLVPPMQPLCALLSMCTSNPFLVRSTSSTGRPVIDPETDVLRQRILFGAIGLLGSTGSVIPEECSSNGLQALQTIKEIFVQLFSVDMAPILSCTIEALATFGRTISAAHAPLLPTFLPQDCIPLFQARSQGMVWKNNQHFSIDNSPLLFDAIASILETKSAQPRLIGTSIFPSISSHHIAPGSYFIQMPTQEGRQALVIFPPGPQSLQDIRHMYEVQDDVDLPAVHALKQVVLSTTLKGGCKCVLAEP